jgi:hypothetical protein
VLIRAIRGNNWFGLNQPLKIITNREVGYYTIVENIIDR